jgi:hypothetical protein
MKSVSIHLVCGIVIILALVASGCVAPPQANNSVTGNPYNPGQTDGVTTTPTIQSFVTEVTPFITTSPGTQSTGQGYSNFATETPIPADQSCLIYFNKQYYLSNGTAVTFNLKNPPMYINYSVIPFNVTVHKVFESRTGGGDKMETLTYSDFSPYSWFEVTVRNKTTGEIYLQDGFGRNKGYSIYTNATLTILKRDDMLIELKGNNITASTGIWVKPQINFDDPAKENFTECKNWGRPQNSLAVQTATTVPTRTYENEVTRAK